VEIEITNRCNLTCPYCIRRLSKPKEFRDMTPNQFNHILKQLLECSYQRRRLVLCGLGEPLMNPHFIEMVNNPLLKKFPKVDFSTNGVLLTQKKIESLIDSGVFFFIKVSLQSSRKDVMETLQRGAKFEDVVENICNLIHYAHGKRTEIRVQYLRTVLNPDETKADFERLLELKFGRGVTFMVKSVGPASLGKKAHSLTIMRDGKPLYRSPQDVCYNKYGRTLVINTYGDLTGCCWDSLSRTQSYGNIFEKSLKQLRSSKLLKSLQKELVNRDFHRLPICKRCLET